jgi:hypothetical protein
MSETERLKRELAEAKREIERLQRVIDSRPAINAGLPESYINWSGQVAAMEFYHATQIVS